MRRPNILLVNVDQQRYDSLGFNGHPLVRTPHLDRLAASGMRFDSAYTPLPVCCPARQSLMCGVIPEIHGGIWNFGSGGSLPVREIDPQRPVWVRQLRDAGYRTAYFGKWHVHPTLDPTHFGFETYADAPDPHPNGPHTGILYEVAPNPFPCVALGRFDTRPVEECHTHLLAGLCADAIERLSADGEPWHIRLDFAEPHLPCLPAEPFASMVNPAEIPPWPNFQETFDGKPYIQRQQLRNWEIEHWTWSEWSIYLAAYFGIISQVDHAIGKVLARLETIGASDNTLIIYTTDHGDAAGSHRMMDKHYVLYEEEVRVPLVVSWPGMIAPGSVCSDFVSHYLDIPVTLLELLGLPAPASYQGRSFLPQLMGQPARNPWPTAFSTYNGQQFGLYCQRMIRDRRYKYIWNPTDVDECYDLENDPHELVNLAAKDERSPLCIHMKKRLYEVFAGLGEPLVCGVWNRYWLGGGLDAGQFRPPTQDAGC